MDNTAAGCFPRPLAVAWWSSDEVHMWWLMAAFAGYGDPDAGVPSAAERELHLWTNAVRMSPSTFRSDFLMGGCSFEDFQDGEKVSKAPLAFHHGLGHAAADHAADMQAHNFMSHDSSDGTSFQDRVPRYYAGEYVGENVLRGTTNVYSGVVRGWMCSSGHRANIMSDRFNELGVGVSGPFMAQDFGGRPVEAVVLNMGAHSPYEPTGQVTFYVDHDGTFPPVSVDVMLDGEPIGMELGWGSPERGVYKATSPTDPGCHFYWFEAEAGGETHRFPEEGAYGFGDCAFDDERAGWLAAGSFGVGHGEGGAGRGCATASGPATLGATAWGLLGLLGAVRIRRRR